MYPPSAILAAGGISAEAAAAVTGLADLDAADVRPAPWWMRSLWTSGTAAMALPWAIYVAPDRLEDADLSVLVLHELVHVRQWQRFGPRRFLWIYLKDYVSGRRRGLAHESAYLGIRFETEARVAVARYLATTGENASGLNP